MKTVRFLMAKARLAARQGFTLVELLIVIALIGVLAVAVLAAINPLEQLNRARDTGMESDASQLLAAIDRYYASQEEFPWVTVDDTTYSNDSALDRTDAADELVGICVAAGCDCGAACDGVLLGQFELKSEFKNRRFLDSAAGETEKLYIGKATGASSSVYACWVPTSQAKRANAVYATDVIPSAIDSCDPLVSGRTWADLANSCFFCIPR